MESKFKVSLFIAILCLFSVPISIHAADYYVATNGSDSNAGTISSPWKNIQKGMSNTPAGSTFYVRGGEYGPPNSDFTNDNVTLKNYPNEQVIINMGGNSEVFHCWSTEVHGAKTGIHIIGSDVTPKTLSNGVVSKKGIVITQGVGAQGTAFLPHGGCDNWEVAGIDFVNMGNGVFQLKETHSKVGGNYSADNWYVHDNRVYGFYRETGMQFNGNNNLIENNEIFKVTAQLDTPFGCYLLNILGHGNVIRGNTLTGTGGTECSGILFEWSQSDANLIENNTITKVNHGIEFQGGDNNTMKNNTISNIKGKGVNNVNYPDGTTSWPCSDYVGSWDEYTAALIPPKDPDHIDYPYYYPNGVYGECQSLNNVTVVGNSTPTPKLGDVNGDDKVDVVDIGIVIDTYGKAVSVYPKSNLNSDTVINIVDIGIIISNYGK